MMINLHGRYRIHEESIYRPPVYLFLPSPSSVKTDLGAMGHYSIMMRGDHIYWDVSWEGEKLCHEVLDKAKKRNHQEKYMLHLYRLIRDNGGETDDVDHLIARSVEMISLWYRVIHEIRRQMVK